MVRVGQNHTFIGIYRVGQNRKYMYKYTVYLVISKLKIPYVHRIYMVLANPRYIRCTHGIFGRGITRYTVIYGVYIRFWPTLFTAANGVRALVCMGNAGNAGYVA